MQPSGAGASVEACAGGGGGGGVGQPAAATSIATNGGSLALPCCAYYAWRKTKFAAAARPCFPLNPRDWHRRALWWRWRTCRSDRLKAHR